MEFSSKFGCGWANWQGASPEKGSVYDVEIDLPSVSSMEVVDNVSSDLNPSISNDDAYAVVIIGEIIRGDGVNSTSLKLGNDVLLLDDDLPLYRAGSIIQFIAHSINLYPINF